MGVRSAALSRWSLKQRRTSGMRSLLAALLGRRKGTSEFSPHSAPWPVNPTVEFPDAVRNTILRCPKCKFTTTVSEIQSYGVRNTIPRFTTFSSLGRERLAHSAPWPVNDGLVGDHHGDPAFL